MQIIAIKFVILNELCVVIPSKRTNSVASFMRVAVSNAHLYIANVQHWCVAQTTSTSCIQANILRLILVHLVIS